MAHDVFISYASEDEPIADAVCATLETQRIRCWIAPRDILASESYGGAIIDAIETSRLLVLVFSASSNRSPQVMREVERAVAKGLPILPFRIEDVPLSSDMEYLISSSHWLDALTPPRERQIQNLAETVGLLLSRTGDEGSAADPGEPRPATAGMRTPMAVSPAAPVGRTKPLLRVPPAAVWLSIALIGVWSLWRAWAYVGRRSPEGQNAACTRNLQAIGRALTAYQRDRGELPPQLSDLYPQYLADERLLYCPAAPPPVASAPDRSSGGRQVPVSYFYEMSLDTDAAGHTLGPLPAGGAMTRRQHKLSQIPNFGDRVPVVLCREHDRLAQRPLAAGQAPFFLRLALQGQVYRSGEAWELEPATVPVVLSCLERDLAAGPERFRSHWLPDKIAGYFAGVQPTPDQRERYRAAASRLAAIAPRLPREIARDVPAAVAALYRAGGDPQKALAACEATAWRLKARPSARFYPIDLRRHLTHRLSDDLDDPSNNLSGLSAGRQTLAEVPFQVDGAVELSKAGGRVTGIPVNRKADRLHFLQGAHWCAASGGQIGAYRLRYADGGQVEIPIQEGLDVIDWWTGGRMLPRSELAWCGKNDRTSAVCLYLRTWQNPRPAVIIRSLDLMHRRAPADPRAVPFLVAVTAAADPS